LVSFLVVMMQHASLSASLLPYLFGFWQRGLEPSASLSLLLLFFCHSVDIAQHGNQTKGWHLLLSLFKPCFGFSSVHLDQRDDTLVDCSCNHVTCQRLSGKQSTRHPSMLLRFLFWVLAKRFPHIVTEPLASLSLLLLFVDALSILIDMAPKGKISIGCFWFFILFWLLLCLSLPKRWYIGWLQLQWCGMQEVEWKVINKASLSASLLFYYFGKEVDKQSYGTVGVPVLASFFCCCSVDTDWHGTWRKGCLLHLHCRSGHWCAGQWSMMFSCVFFLVGKSCSLVPPRPTALKGVNAVYCLHLFLFQELSLRQSASPDQKTDQKS